MNSIRLTNFAQLKQADIALGDLTVLVGRQATGKTLLLETLKLLVDTGYVHSELSKHGLAWGRDFGTFFDVFYGEGMANVWSAGSTLEVDEEAGVAPNSIYGHFKALNTFPGFGKTSWILKAMNAALEWGADVISMSLGGQQQGRVGEDPYTRFIEANCKENAGDEDGAIFVVAAGNAGADGYTIGSPGVSFRAVWRVV